MVADKPAHAVSIDTDSSSVRSKQDVVNKRVVYAALFNFNRRGWNIKRIVYYNVACAGL